MGIIINCFIYINRIAQMKFTLFTAGLAAVATAAYEELDTNPW